MKKQLAIQTRNQLWKLETEKKSHEPKSFKSRATPQSKEKTLNNLDQRLKKVQSIIEELKKKFKK